MSWLQVLEVMHVAHILRPYAEGGRQEIVAQPKSMASTAASSVMHAAEKSFGPKTADFCSSIWFSMRYPRGRNLVVAADETRRYSRRLGDLDVCFVPLGRLREEVGAEPVPARR